MRSREELVQWAKIAEQAERFEDMAESMKELTENLEKEEKKELTQEERNLLSVAYKNVVGARRSSWRMVSLIESKSESNPTKRELAKSFRAKIEKELDTICTEVFRLLQDHLLARRESLNNESLVFYLKMLGDYHRYQAEYATEEKKTEIVGSALQSYQNAYDMAMQTMEATNTNRLGLALNFSVFYYEIFNAPEKACHLAQDAFDSAITTIDELDQESYKDSTLIMQLLRDNLTLWTTDSTQECNDGDN